MKSAPQMTLLLVTVRSYVFTREHGSPYFTHRPFKCTAVILFVTVANILSYYIYY